MAFCVQCGNGVADQDLFCAKCGTRQKTAPSPQPAPSANPLGISDRTAGLLCYIPWMGWIGSVLVLATDYYRSRDRVRFHAFQGLYLCAAWLLADWIFSPLLTGFNPFFPGRFAGGLLKLAIVGTWIFMLIRVNRDDDYHLPILGDLAERSVNEQRS
jgi:uncharacterized membrane protein